MTELDDEIPLKHEINVEIRVATSTDLNDVFTWLEADEQVWLDAEKHAYDTETIIPHDVERGFWCNRDMIKDAWSEGELWVLAQCNNVIAFAALSWSGIDFLEVRPGYRRKGFGRRLALYCIDMFKEKGRSDIIIEFAPKTSVVFWQSLGFQLHDSQYELMLSMRL